MDRLDDPSLESPKCLLPESESLVSQASDNGLVKVPCSWDLGELVGDFEFGEMFVKSKESGTEPGILVACKNPECGSKAEIRDIRLGQ